MRRARPAFLVLAGVACSCTGEGRIDPVDGRLLVSPESIDLGQLVVATPFERRLDLENAGDAPLTMTATIAGAGAGDIALLDLPTRLGPGGTHVVELSVVATALGPIDAQLIIRTDAADQPDRFIPIRGVRIPRALSVTPAVLDFGSTRVGAVSRRSLRVENPLASPAVVELTVDPPGAFAIAGPETLRLDANETLDVDLELRPPAPGTFFARLHLRRTTSPQVEVVVPLAGHGTPSSLVCDPERIEFAAVNPGRCGEATTTCRNIAPASITVQNARLSPSSPTFVADVPRGALRPGETLTALITFCPDAQTDYSATLDVDVLEPDGSTRRTTLAVTGRGGGPSIALSDEQLGFGGALVGRETVRNLNVGNVGFDALVLSRITIVPADAPFELRSPTNTIAPDEEYRLTLAFTPDTVGDHQGQLVIQSNDASRPTVRVPLFGTAVDAAPCAVTLSPASLSFGAIQAGTPVTRDITIEASAGAPCAYYDARLEQGDRFTLLGVQNGVVPAGQSRTFSVTYASDQPSPPSGDRDVFVVDIPNAPPGEHRVPVAGTITPRELVVHPEALDFGTIGLDYTAERTLAVFNVGDTVHRIGAVALDAAASPTLTVAGIDRAPPFDLEPGQSFVVRVTFASTMPVTASGSLLVDSDRFAVPLEVPITGEAAGGACGHVAGTICAPTGGIPSVGASVTFTAAGGQTTNATTDTDGRFYVHCVAPGAGTIAVTKGHFSTSIPATVNSGQTTVLGGTNCLDPSSARIAVVLGAYDRVEQTLGDLGLPYDAFDGTLGPAPILSTPALLNTYDVLFLPCGIDDSTVRSPAVATNLRAFVEGGGTIYTSDEAYDAVEAAFETAIDFNGDDAVADAAQTGIDTRITGRVLDPLILRQLTQQTTVGIDYSIDYARIDGAGAATEVHVVGVTDNGGPLRPLLVSFGTLTGGRVVYTTFHNSDAAIDPQMRRVLEVLISGL